MCVVGGKKVPGGFLEGGMLELSSRSKGRWTGVLGVGMMLASALAGYVEGVHLGCIMNVSLLSPRVRSGPLGHGGGMGVRYNLGVGSLGGKGCV